MEGTVWTVGHRNVLLMNETLKAHLNTENIYLITLLQHYIHPFTKIYFTHVADYLDFYANIFVLN